MLADHKREFLEFALAQGALQFRDFELKSGRISPYFFNVGRFDSGDALRRLGYCYADALKESELACDGLFGPAYKGIPLIVAMSIALAERYRLDMPYAFNRKEAKGHGEGGRLVGSALKGDIVIVDDVVSAGTAVREVMDYFDGRQARARALLIAIDRQEKGRGGLSAIQEVERDYGLSVISIVKLDDVVEYLMSRGDFDKEVADIMRYRERYGISG